MKTWEYLGKGNDVENLRAFLYRVANNLIIDDSRKKKAISLDELYEEKGFEPSEDSENAMNAKIEVKNLMVNLQKLDPIYREPFIMRFIDGMNPAEIAEIMGESKNNISVRLNRATKKIKELLN